MARPAEALTRGAHVPVLDGVRGLAIALVMLQHFCHGVARGPSAVDAAVFAAAGRGWIGVDLFFVLSGFLITGILWDARAKPDYFRTFYVRRALRIFPAYYAVLLLIFVVAPALGIAGVSAYVADSAPDQVWHWTYLTNFRIAWRGEWYDHHVPNVFWSLSIEEQFYLLWPVVVLLASRRWLMRICVAMCVSALALRLALVAGESANWVSRFVLTPARWDGLAVGAFLALTLRGDTNLPASRRAAWIVLGSSAAVFAWLTLQRSEGWRETPIQDFHFTAVALLFGALLWLAVTAPRGARLERWLSVPALIVLGKYSYALYLWHGPMSTFARSLWDPTHASLVLGSRMPALMVHLVMAAAFSFAAAWLSWHLLEKHFLRLKDRFSRRTVPGEARSDAVAASG